eukprot:scaffold2119_cov355-Prasinococcus_capsulatus_cf.AAC.5
MYIAHASGGGATARAIFPPNPTPYPEFVGRAGLYVMVRGVEALGAACGAAHRFDSCRVKRAAEGVGMWPVSGLYYDVWIQPKDSDERPSKTPILRTPSYMYSPCVSPGPGLTDDMHGFDAHGRMGA